MKDAVAIAKEADTKKGVSPTKSDNIVHRVRNELERQLGSLRGVIGNIRRDGGKPSVDSIATELSSMHTAQRTSVLLALQHTHGNRYVQRVVTGIQAKLKVGQPGDMYEQEADRVADQVMRMPEPHTVPPIVHEVLRAPGQPLDLKTCNLLESRFGHNFDQVRVHTDAKASESAETVNAYAYTVGQDIVFRAGQYAPSTTTGMQLLAHEVAHVLQQRTLAPAIQSALTINSPTGADEIEADRLAGHILDGSAMSSVLQTRHTSLQRNVNASIGREPDPFQQNARVCLVHLHADEQNALEAARGVRNNFCRNLLYVNNPTGHRCVSVVGLSGQGGRTCTADPNRIFSSDPDVTRRNAFGGDCGCPNDLRREAIGQLNSFSTSFMTAINECRRGRQGNLPVVAFHNNLGFSIQAYQSGGSDVWATATVREIRGLATAGGFTARLSALESRLPRGLQNPIVQSQSRPGGMSQEEWRRQPEFARNFFVTTQIEDFLSIAEAGQYNVVLQTRQNIGAPAGRDDGSLSIALGGERYINIEVAGKQQNADIVAFNQQMATDALTRLGISQGPCVVQPTPGRPSRPPHIMMRTMQSVPEVRPQTTDTRVQRADVLCGRYSSNQFTPTVGQDWAEPIRPRFTGNQFIQRRILIGSDGDEMDEQERSSFIQAVRDGTLMARNRAHRQILLSQPQLTENILNEMVRASEDLRFSNETELVAELARRIMPRYLLGLFTPEEGPEWVQVPTGYLRREVAEAFGRMQGAARLAGHNIVIFSATRTFERQREIWNEKMQFNPSRGTFGVFEPNVPPVSIRCAGMLTPADQSLREWNTRNANHIRCWTALTEAERALEVLKMSSAPGISRHHWGTDIDLNSVDPQAWEQSPLRETYDWLRANAHTFGFHQPYTPRQQRGNRGYSEEKWHWSYTAISQQLLSEYQRLLYNSAEFQRQLQGRNVEAISFIVSHYQEYVGSVAQPSPAQVARKEDKGISKSRNIHTLETQVRELQGRGQPLPEVTRIFFESRFGYDFSQVHVHTNAQAAKMTQALNAQAFTLGHDIVFGRGYYAPEKTEGQRLLAHELTHTIQQGSVTEKQKPLSTNPEITSHVQAVRHNHDKKKY
jgi:LAS superfamily LD-carboxypeptidase LdcB